MPYRVELKPSVDKALSKLPSQVQKRIITEVLSLEREPRPHGAIKLGGSEELYRIRIGNYRVVYQIRDDVLLVLVVVIAHRREVYRRR